MEFSTGTLNVLRQSIQFLYLRSRALECKIHERIQQLRIFYSQLLVIKTNHCHSDICHCILVKSETQVLLRGTCHYHTVPRSAFVPILSVYQKYSIKYGSYLENFISYNMAFIFGEQVGRKSSWEAPGLDIVVQLVSTLTGLSIGICSQISPNAL